MWVVFHSLGCLDAAATDFNDFRYMYSSISAQQAQTLALHNRTASPSQQPLQSQCTEDSTSSHLLLKNSCTLLSMIDELEKTGNTMKNGLCCSTQACPDPKPLRKLSHLIKATACMSKAFNQQGPKRITLIRKPFMHAHTKSGAIMHEVPSLRS